LALSIITRSTVTPWAAKNARASVRNRAQVVPRSSLWTWTNATREWSSTAICT
jgi:hypothetical protein